ncbi:hypothetical protein JCM19992_12500 [Thermostilla marina]
MIPRRNSEDDRAAWAQGWSIAYTIVGIGLETALPALLGAWLDRRWDTGPWLLLAGVAIGLLVGGSSLISFAVRQQKATARHTSPVGPHHTNSTAENDTEPGPSDRKPPSG